MALQPGLLVLLAHAAVGMVLLQERSRRATTVVADGEEDSSFAQVRQTCAALANNGSYFTVDVEVGTPGQRFSVVADTGSNTLIVPSCVCQQAGSCISSDQCFTGTNRSSSFTLVEVGGKPLSFVLTFGSGDIEGVVAQEIVRVGGLEVNMTDGILLMTDKALDFGGPFEGILGLGIPQVDSVAAVGGQRFLDPPGFLEQGGVGRFAICFNEESSGVLRLGPPEVPGMTWHTSVGVVHWGLDFRGISVAGDEPVQLNFCRPEDMRAGQQTPCGAIPDSGTTLILGPREQVSVLLGSVCDNWPRCKAARAAVAKKLGFLNLLVPEPWAKVTVLEALLMDCEGIDELPALHFHVAGGNGTEQTLALPGRAYVFEMAFEQREALAKEIEGPGNISSAVRNATAALFQRTGGRQRVCMPAFSAMEYNTVLNGPAWILGTPFFYEFNVGYDLLSKPPAIALQSVRQAPCGSCDAALGLVSSDVNPTARDAAADAAQLRRPRQLSGPVRRPSFELGRPL